LQNLAVAGPSVASGLVFWKGIERLANWDNHFHTREGRQERMQ